MESEKQKLDNLVASHTDDTCLICGAKPSFIGIFIPHNPSLWGGTPNKTRMFRYCLCDQCKKEATEEQIEKIIHSTLYGGSAYVA